jgi:hypothetical protein
LFFISRFLFLPNNRKETERKLETMEFYKKILILCIVLLTMYILFRLLSKRWKIQQENAIANANKIEPFTSEIKPQNTNNANLALIQYVVKGSFHSAYNYNTNKIDLALLSTILQRGVRFLDFEVYSVNGEAVVGYSSSLNPSANTIESSNSPEDPDTLLSTIFNKINLQKPPNLTDPLFIQLRIKSKLPALYSKVAKAIDSAFSGVLFSNKIDLQKPLSTYKGKTIIVIDKINSTSGYSDFAKCKAGSVEGCYDLNKYVNLETGSDVCVSTTHATVTTERPKTLHIKDDNVTVEVDGKVPTKWIFSIPNPMDSTNKYDIEDMIKNHGVNIALFRFDQDDTTTPGSNLAKYEKLFGNNSYLTMVNALQILKNN